MKSTLSALLSAAALSGVALGAVLGTALPSTACIYGDRMNSTSTSITGNGSGSSSSSIGFNSPNQSGFVAAGLAGLGLFAGGMLLRAKLNKSSDAALSSASETDEAVLTANEPTAVKAASVFPIDVPAEALTPAADRAKESV